MDKHCDVICTNLSKAYGVNRVLRNVSFVLPYGSVTCLMAPSGSGKTTLFRILLGLENPDSGTIQGVEPGSVSMMFQEDRLCEKLNALENIALVLASASRRKTVQALLEEILPADCMRQPVMELSGGQRRRVSLVRALAYPSGFVVLDEPFTGLDEATKRRVIDFIIRHRNDRSLLMATHNKEDAQLLGAACMNLDELQGE